METELITFETAVLAKEKGFDWKVYDDLYNKVIYWNGEEIPHSLYDCLYEEEKINDSLFKYEIQSGYIPNEYLSKLIMRPTQSLFQRWLREVHNIHIWIIPNTLWDYGYYYFKDGGYTLSKMGFKSYELALETALQEGLKLIK